MVQVFVFLVLDGRFLGERRHEEGLVDFKEFQIHLNHFFFRSFLFWGFLEFVLSGHALFVFVRFFLSVHVLIVFVRFFLSGHILIVFVRFVLILLIRVFLVLFVFFCNLNLFVLREFFNGIQKSVLIFVQNFSFFQSFVFIKFISFFFLRELF